MDVINAGIQFKINGGRIHSISTTLSIPDLGRSKISNNSISFSEEILHIGHYLKGAMDVLLMHSDRYKALLRWI